MDYQKIVSEAQERLVELEAERAALQELVAAAERLVKPVAQPHHTATAPKSRPSANWVQVVRTSSKVQPTRKVVREVLRANRRAMLTRELLVLVRERGIEVGGKDPIATLSARLSNADEFKNHGGTVGWWFAGEAVPTPQVSFEEAEEKSSEGQSPASNLEREGGESYGTALDETLG